MLETFDIEVLRLLRVRHRAACSRRSAQRRDTVVDEEESRRSMRDGARNQRPLLLCDSDHYLIVSGPLFDL